MNEMMISNVNARGETLGKDLVAELENHKDLESLDLKGFELTDNVVNILSQFHNLHNLNLYNCTSSQKIYADFKKIKKIVIDNCRYLDLSGIELPENVLIMGCGTVDLSRLLIGDNVKNLRIHSSEIINSTFFEKMKSLKTLNVDGSNLDNEDSLNRLKFKVSNEFEYHPIG